MSNENNSYLWNDAQVKFEVVNYAQLFPLTDLIIDSKGEVRFTTGLEDLLVEVHKEGIVTHEIIDVRLQDGITIILEDKKHPHGSVEHTTLVPPEGVSPDENKVDEVARTLHQTRHQEALDTRNTFIGTFFLGEKATEWAKDYAPCEEKIAKHLEPARGNYEEIQAFFQDEET